jgi:protein SCO1/2
MKYFIFIASIVALFSCKKGKKTKLITALPYFNSAKFTPEWEKPEHKIPDFKFTNQNGEIITNKTYEGKIYIADFFFTSCPGICTKLTKNKKNLQEAYKNEDDIMMLSHTVMPWKDSVPLLKSYAIKNNVNDKKWHLVTGNKDELYDIARTGYFADEDFEKTQNKSEFIHTENFILVDKNGFIRGVYNGTLTVDVERLKRHVKILKNKSELVD